MKDGNKKAPVLVTVVAMTVVGTSIGTGLLLQLVAEPFSQGPGLIRMALRNFSLPIGAYIALRMGWLPLFGGMHGLFRAMVDGITPDLAYTTEELIELNRKGKVVKRCVAISDTHNKHKWLKMPWVAMVVVGAKRERERERRREREEGWVGVGGGGDNGRGGGSGGGSIAFTFTFTFT